MDGNSGPESEEELRDRCMDMDHGELIELLVQKHAKANEADTLREELFLAKTKREAAERKVGTLESEGHTLLSRAMSAEGRLVELTAENEKMQLELSSLQDAKAQRESDDEELKHLREEIDGLRDAKAMVDAERKKAEEHNELRLSVEHAFNELSKQHEDLMQQLEEAQAEARALRAKAKDDASKILSLQEEKDALADQLKAAKAEADAARERESKLQAEFNDFKKKAAGWKKDAERALALESKADSLAKANEKQLQEMKALRAALRQAELDAARFEEERKKWAEMQKKNDANRFLKQQLAELQAKHQSFNEREKAWLRERAELEAKIKRLQWELRNKNPSQLRMMEVEVQNQLLLGMLQHTNEPSPKKKVANKAKAHYGGSPIPAPRVLPPLDSSSYSDELSADAKPVVRSSPIPEVKSSEKSYSSADDVPTEAQSRTPNKTTKKSSGDALDNLLEGEREPKAERKASVSSEKASHSAAEKSATSSVDASRKSSVAEGAKKTPSAAGSSREDSRHSSRSSSKSAEAEYSEDVEDD